VTDGFAAVKHGLVLLVIPISGAAAALFEEITSEIKVSFFASDSVKIS
jgi:hypothetical protein